VVNRDYEMQYLNAFLHENTAGLAVWLRQKSKGDLIADIER
jgi:hypothetical protein